MPTFIKFYYFEAVFFSLTASCLLNTQAMVTKKIVVIGDHVYHTYVKFQHPTIISVSSAMLTVTWVTVKSYSQDATLQERQTLH